MIASQVGGRLLIGLTLEDWTRLGNGKAVKGEVKADEAVISVVLVYGRDEDALRQGPFAT